MAHVVSGAGEHGAGNLEEDEARSRIDIGSCRPFKRDKNAAICRAPSQQNKERRTRGEWHSLFTNLLKA